MILLSISIMLALLITIGLPIAAGFWLKNKLGVSWRIISYGALGYFIVQALVTLLFTGFSSLVNNGVLVLSDQAFVTSQIILSVVLAALLGVLVRWAGMKYLQEDMDNLSSAYGIGVGYGGAESIMLVGIPLLTTFITMLSNMNIDPETTTLDPALVAQLEELWQVSPLIPLAGSFERIAAFVMHITVTILVLQVFKKNNWVWLAAATGLELVVNGLIVGLSEAGVLFGWVIVIALVLMVGNLVLLYHLKAFEFDINQSTG